MKSVSIIVTREFLLLKALLVVIYLALEIYYHFFISSQFDYMGYVWDLDLFKYLITKIVFLFLLAGSFLIYKRSGFLYSIYLLLIFFFYIPNAILFSFSDFPIAPYVSNIFFVSFFLLAPYIKFNIPQWQVPEKFRGIILASLAVLLFVPIVVTFGAGFNFRTLLLSEVYETREVFSEKLTGLLAYFYNIEVKTLLPATLIFFMIYRRYYLAIFFILVLLYFYMISGNKLVYFTSFLVIFFFFVGKSTVEKISNFFLVVIIFFTLFPVIDNFILNEPLFAGTFVNRFLFIPALLTHYYFDFFDGNPFFFAESHFFNYFVHSPYNLPVGFLISKEYFNEPSAYANNGIVSDGFMNLGYAGVIIFSAIFTLLFSLFNSLNLSKQYYGIYFSYIYIILSAPLLSCFVTGGILLFIVLGSLILNRTEKILSPA